MRTLYISYFGLREPLVQTQVLPYLQEIEQDGIDVRLLTFEPGSGKSWSNQEKVEWRERLEKDRIHWFSMAYHKRPSLPAKLYDICAGAFVIAARCRREGIDVVHARGHVAAAMGWLATKICNARLIFDIRGFMPEEYVDAGLWEEKGWLYRWTKAAEKKIMAEADGFVVLTERARRILFPGCADSDSQGRPIEVIPCCVDLDRFSDAETQSRDRLRQQLGWDGRYVIAYVGALGGWYLTQQTAEFLACARSEDPSVFSLILTQSPYESLAERLRTLGFASGDYLIRKVSPAEIPRFLRAADAAVSFIKPCYSKLSSSPTKIAEYLAGGLPIICNAGIGDLDEVIEADRVGVLVREFSQTAYLRALGDVRNLGRGNDAALRCRASAKERFDLRKVGGFRYRRLYSRIRTREGSALQDSKVNF